MAISVNNFYFLQMFVLLQISSSYENHAKVQNLTAQLRVSMTLSRKQEGHSTLIVYLSTAT